ncbi:hypothetical protein I3843_08G121900 [Carya illinoinensis]|nr:hypothetical protein I3843_08G121900 [Carya illinoinensis]
MGVSKKDGGLGFTDLESFNKAMLAKQLWRVLNNPNSPVAQILKQKYFKRGTILNAKKGTNSPLVWQSLWSSIELIKAGSLWRVGFGTSIIIWHDNWVKNSVLLQLNPSTFFSTVSELINEGECRWKKEVLDQLFQEEEVQKICQIPLRYTANGVFNVRSAYYLQQSLMRQMKGECSSIVTGLIDWKHLWSLNVPMRIKLFNLANRKVVDVDLCSICKREVESALHVVWCCPAASDVWAMPGCPIHKWSCSFPDFYALWLSLCTKLDVDALQLVCFIMRRIWLRRNYFVHGKDLESPQQVVIAATADRDMFLSSLTSTDAVPSNISSDRGDIRWKKPEFRTLKENWDASVSTKLNRAGCGIIIRDEQGNIMACVCASQKPIVKPVMAEGLALRREMEVCADLGLGRVVFEGDSQTIVQAMNSDEVISADYGILVHDARSMLLIRPQWQVVFVHREANYAAHQLAKLALDYENEQIWIEDGSMQVMSIV